jgi:hypothetical protein
MEEEHVDSIGGDEEQVFAPRSMGQRQPWRAYYFCGLHEIGKKDPVQPYAHKDGDPPHTPEEYAEHPELIYVPKRGDVIREAAIIAVPGDYGTPGRNCFFVYCDVCTTYNKKGHRVRVETDELQKTGFYKPCDNPDRNPDVRRHEIYVPAKDYVWPMLADDGPVTVLASAISRGVSQFEYIRDELKRWLAGEDTQLPEVHVGASKHEEYRPFPPLRDRVAAWPWKLIIKIAVAVVLVIGAGVGAYIAMAPKLAPAETDRGPIYREWQAQFEETRRMPDRKQALQKGRALLAEVRKERASGKVKPEHDALLWSLEDRLVHFVGPS